MHIPSLKFLTIAAMLATCSACGGGGGGGISTTSGALVAPVVEGLTYKTPSRVGITDSDGVFLYEPGETVSFSLGDTAIGEALGSESLSLVNLVPGTVLPTCMEDAMRFVDPPGREARDDRYVNTLVLLYTIDEDNDATNGVQIPAIYSTEKVVASLPLSSPRSTFADGIPFRSFLADAVAEGAWGGIGRNVVSARRALQHHYEDTGLQTTFWRNAVVSIDWDADGAIDTESQTTFGPSGLPAFVYYDDDGDGLVDRLQGNSYNAYDQLTEETMDTGLDGIDRRSTWIMDPNGRELKHTNDIGDDGTIDSQTVIHRNAVGLMTMFETDSDGDGVWDNRYTYTYDVKGNKTQIERDIGANGSIDERSAFEYDVNGRVTLNRDDQDGDGTWDYVREFTYDGAGRMTMERTDNDGNGTWDRVAYNEFNEDGTLLTYRRDNDNDGTIDYASHYTYDARGAIQMRSTDDNGDGVADRTTFWDYNAAGDVAMVSEDDNADGVVDDTTAYIYNAQGLRMRVEQDNGADGVLDVVKEYSPEPGTWLDVRRR